MEWADTAENPERQEDAQPVVLLVDDDPGALRLLELAFEETAPAIRTITVSDGAAALDALHRRGEHEHAPVPDVVILDLDLPKVSGQEVLREIRGVTALETLPVVIFSQNDEQSIIDECYDLGATAYVVKPEKYDALLDVITTISAFWGGDETCLPD